MSTPLVIASEMDGAFNDALRAHVLAPRIVEAPADAPWRVADEADVLLVRPSPPWRAARAADAPRPAGWPGRLRWVGSASVGIDYYPPWLLDAPTITCGRGVASAEIADYVIAAIYLRAKDLEAVRVRDAAAWQSRPLGSVVGATIGILGFGGIGQAVATRAIALGARVVVTSRRPDRLDPVTGVLVLPDADAVAAQADHLVLALPATPATRGLVDAALLARMKPGAHIVNVARGAIIDQEALIVALDAGRPGFATLDVTDPEPLPAGHPLYAHPAVRLTPHVSSNYLRVRDVLLARIGANIHRFAKRETLRDLVDVVNGY